MSALFHTLRRRPRERLQGMPAFVTVWFGQLVSTLGSGLTGFALGVWIYQTTGSTTRFALSNIFYLLPVALLSPLAGTVVDRWDRRKILLLADSGQALITLAIALLLFNDRLLVWHVYISVGLASAISAFQNPAHQASVSMLVPRQHLGRAAGMAQIGGSLSRLLAPLSAGFLIAWGGLATVLLIDMLTFLVAVLTLALVHIPQPPASPESSQVGDRFWSRLRFGWRYILERPGLLGMQILIAVLNLFANAALILTTPLVLTFADAGVLGIVTSVGALGFLAGSLLMSAWGGPRRRATAILIFIALQGIAIILGGLSPSAALIAASRLLVGLTFVIIGAMLAALWQTKVAPDVQGRVFSIRYMIALSVEPLAHAGIGPLTDGLLEPWMAAGGALAGSVGAFIGVGPGRGMGLAQLIMGALIVACAIAGLLHPRIRRVDVELPDAIADAEPSSPSPTRTAELTFAIDQEER